MRRSIDSSSVLSGDDLSEYDIISDGQQSLESSIADLGLIDKATPTIHEPAPTKAAETLFVTPSLATEDIQAYVRAFVATDQRDAGRRVVRVYVDGLFDPLDAGHALQLRQAKLSFPAVQLLVGVFSDDICRQQGVTTRVPHLERCELLRHCRWVDEVVPDAPWKLDEAFVTAMRIDYVAIEEGVSCNPDYDMERVKGYDFVKSLRKCIPTRRTIGLTRRPPPPPPISETIDIPPSKNGTLRRIPPPLPPLPTEPADGERIEEISTPFDEPLVNLFD